MVNVVSLWDVGRRCRLTLGRDVDRSEFEDRFVELITEAMRGGKVEWERGAIVITVDFRKGDEAQDEELDNGLWCGPTRLGETGQGQAVLAHFTEDLSGASRGFPSRESLGVPPTYLILSTENLMLATNIGMGWPVVNYKHKVCQATMELAYRCAASQTADPGFYAYAWCSQCGRHLPVEQFEWKAGAS